MSDTKISPILQLCERLLEFTVRTVQRNTGAKSVILIVVHEDGTVQNSAAVQPGTEQRVVYALQSLADKIEKGEGGKLEISQPFKN